MRRQIDLHVLQLEDKVRERTRELEASNEAFAAAGLTAPSIFAAHAAPAARAAG